MLRKLFNLVRILKDLYFTSGIAIAKEIPPVVAMSVRILSEAVE